MIDAAGNSFEFPLHRTVMPSPQPVFCGLREGFESPSFPCTEPVYPTVLSYEHPSREAGNPRMSRVARLRE